MKSTTVGLRERKRREVRARIEAAAVFLVLRDGLESTTVDAISERADVSPRTFFNYFESKDSAILGLHQRESVEELIAEHLSEGGGAEGAQHARAGLVTSVVRLLLLVVGAPQPSGAAIHQDRLEVIRRHPQVLSGQFAQLSARSSTLVEAVEQILARAPGAAAQNADRRAQAEVFLSLCAGGIRVAVREWAAEGSPHAVDDVERRAVALIEQIVRKLA